MKKAYDPAMEARNYEFISLIEQKGLIFGFFKGGTSLYGRGG